MILTKFLFVFAIIEEAKAVPGVSILSLIDMVSFFSGDFRVTVMLVTLCWRLFSLCWRFSNLIGHQHLKIVTNTFVLQHRCNRFQ